MEDAHSSARPESGRASELDQTVVDGPNGTSSLSLSKAACVPAVRQIFLDSSVCLEGDTRTHGTRSKHTHHRHTHTHTCRLALVCEVLAFWQANVNSFLSTGLQDLLKKQCQKDSTPSCPRRLSQTPGTNRSGWLVSDDKRKGTRSFPKISRQDKKRNFLVFKAAKVSYMIDGRQMAATQTFVN